MTVIEFPQQEPELGYWLCNCGCQTHYVRTDGEIECAHCGALASGDVGGGWIDLPPPEKMIEDFSGERHHIVALDGPDAAIRRMMKRNPAENASAVIVLWDDGMISTWGQPFGTRDRRGWLRRGLESARKALL